MPTAPQKARPSQVGDGLVISGFVRRSGGDHRQLLFVEVLRALPALICGLGIALAVTGQIAIGIVLAVIGAAIFAANLVVGSSRRLLARIGGRPADEWTDARLLNVVNGLCVANGLRIPRLMILDDPAANTLVLGRSAPSAVIVISVGLLELLDRMELEGVVAHCLAQIKRGDVIQGRTATTALGALAAILPSAGTVVARLAGIRQVPYEDFAGVSMTRYPPGLIAALEKLDKAANTRPATISATTARLTASMWLIPLEEAIASRPLAGALDVDLRIAALREL